MTADCRPPTLEWPTHTAPSHAASGLVTLGKSGHCPRRILLLQGPVGPFFTELQDALVASGYDVRRVIFNFGDQVFARRRSCIRFAGTLPEWASWLKAEIANRRPDAIILFGCNRPIHRVAREVAEMNGIPVVSLEEGYLRAGYASCEAGGNNQHSPMARWRSNQTFAPQDGAGPSPCNSRFSFVAMCLWGAIYYLMRDLASKETEEHLYHRQRERILPLSLGWAAHMLGRVAARLTEYPTRRVLRQSPGYLLVPLQVTSDSQLVTAARGWTTDRLIDAVLRAASSAGCCQKIVFKLHPLERRSSAMKHLVRKKARQFGIPRNRLIVLRTGRIGDLTAKASGMIVINSTSAFSAMHHDVPILVLGDAVFRHKEIVTLGDDETDVARFMAVRRAKPRVQINAFLTELKARSLIPGGFYGRAERKAAIAAILGRLEKVRTMVQDMRAAGA